MCSSLLLVSVVVVFSSNIGRTYFINPVEEQKQVYGVLTDVYVACKKALKHGLKISGVWAAAQRIVEPLAESERIPSEWI